MRQYQQLAKPTRVEPSAAQPGRFTAYYRGWALPDDYPNECAAWSALDQHRRTDERLAS